MSDRGSTSPSCTTVYKLQIPAVDVQTQAVPPCVPQKSRAARVADDGSAAEQLHEQRPFSPLTLSELGLLPPSTPSALLDIPAPLSFSMAEREREREAEPRFSNKACFAKHKTPDTSKAEDKDVTGEMHAEPKSPLKGHACAELLETPCLTASPTTYQDPLLTSFLQSLTEDPIALARGDGEHAFEAQCQATASNVLVSVSGSEKDQHVPQKASKDKAEEKRSITANALASRKLDLTHRTDFRHLIQSSTAASNSSLQCWANSQPSRVELSNTNPTASFKPGPHFKRTVSVGESGDRAAPSSTTFQPFTSQPLQVTSTPLERAQPVAVSGGGQSASNPNAPGSIPTACSSAQAIAPSNLSKTPWQFDSTSLSHFALPQALPLQPEHRYPIQILETDVRYDPDFETDRETEGGPRSGVSPSRSDSLSSASASKRRAAARTLRKSPDSSQPNEASRCTGNMLSNSPKGVVLGGTVSSVLSSSLHSREGQNLGSTVAPAATPNPLKLVPLSNVVRSGSWSGASYSSSGLQEGRPRPVGSTEGRQAEHSSSLCTTAPSAISREASPSKVRRDTDPGVPKGQAMGPRPLKQSSSDTTPARRTSHDFTRQALLDFIRRTNLGMANNGASGESGTPAASKPSTTTEESMPGHEATNKEPWASSTWSSSVPAELQTHLQNWQDQRKRQKLLNEGFSLGDKITKQECASSSTLTDQCAAADSTPSSEKLQGQPRRRGKRSMTESEQERKLRKQEHYQRLFVQLQAQMRLKMQQEKQKQKGVQESKLSKDGSDGKTGKDISIEQRGPSTPKATSSGARRDSNKTTEGPTGFRAGFNGDGDPVATNSKARSDCFGEGVAQAAPNSRIGVTPPPSTKSRTPILSSLTWPEVDLATLRPSWDHKPTHWEQWSHAYWPTLSDPLHSHHIGGFATSRHGCQPTFHNGLGVGCDTTQTALISVPERTWTPVTGNSPFIPWHPSHTTELTLKHHNWLHDVGPATCNNSTAASWQNSAPSLSLSTASMPLLHTSVKPPIPLRQGPLQTPTALSANNKRPFSPGAEVVFWAVKGEHSTKLVGTVESLTENSATIVVPSEAVGSMNNGPGASRPWSSTGKVDVRKAHKSNADVFEYHKHISFDNIVAKDQAIVLGFV